MGNELNHRIAQLTETAIRSAVWQVRYWIPFELSGELVCLSVCVWGILFTAKRWKAFQDAGLEPLAIGVWVVLGLLGAFLVSVGIPNTLSAIWNPEFWAIRALLSQ